MTKALFALTLLSFVLCPHAEAQKGWYLKAGAGYAFPTAGQTVDNNGTPYGGTVNIVNNTAGNSFTYDVKRVSFSSGMQGTVGLGYMFNKNMGFELAANLGIAPMKYKLTYAEDGVPPVYNYGTSTQYANFPITMMPAFVLQATEKKVTLFARGGLAIPFSKKLINDLKTKDHYSSDPNEPVLERNITLELETRFGIGFSGAMGAKYKIGKTLTVWAEGALLSMSLYAKQQNITSYVVNGYNYLPYLSDEERHQVYDTKSGGSSNSLPMYSVPFSNVALNIGINVAL